MPRSGWTSLRKHAGRFAQDSSGNIAIIFALALLPIVSFTGFAVDYSHANSVKAAMQAAIDSTALMLSKEASTDSSTTLQTNAQKYFAALFTRPEAINVVVTASYTTTGGSAIVVNSSANVPTAFLGVIGYKNIPVNASSTAKWGSSRLRVALALDNTGSMSEDGKMAALKSATKGLLTQLKNAATVNGDVYVSIIPFGKDVNVGKSNYNANWIDWTDWDSDNQTCDKKNKNCKPNNHNTWNGCVTDRDRDYDQKVTAPNPADASLKNGKASTLYPAEQYGNCPLAMMGLSYNWSAMNSLVDQMYPAGTTNQPIGLVWGWLSLVGGGPLTAPAKDSNYQYQDVIILMSDGLNTEDRWSHMDPHPSQFIDNRMYQKGNGSGTCANIKAAGITIYTIHVNTGGDPMSTLLQNCASGTDKFWMVTSSSGLGTVFNTIGTNLTKLRVAK